MKKTFTLAASATAALALTGALLVPTSATASWGRADPAVHQAEGFLTGGGGLMPAGENTPQYVSYPEGGVWSHGTNDGVYSNYYHPSKRHGSTAMNGRGLSHKVTGIPSGSWSYAHIGKTIAGNSAYWHLN